MRTSNYIADKQGTAFFAAMRYARDLEEQPNLFVTVNFVCTDCPRGEASIVMQRLVNNHFARWLRYESNKAKEAGGTGYPLAYVWVAEAPDNLPHTHWCVYVPPELKTAFARKMPKWIATVAGTIRDEGCCIDITEITAIMGVARYSMKGLSARNARRRFVKPEDQGTVYGKRVAISRSLGKKARNTKKQPAPVFASAMAEAA